MPEIVVSMPARDTGRFIGAALRSVLAQEGVDFEVVVVDDGSTDDTAAVASSFEDDRLRVIRNPRSLGISASHNVIRRDSDSRFIAHVDSDDLLKPGALRRMVQSLREDDGVQCAHCNYEFIGHTGEPLHCRRLLERQRYLRQRTPEMDHRRELIMRGGEAANHLRTYRRTVFDVVGDFDESMPSGGEDYDMALRIVDQFKVCLVPDFLYQYRIYGESTTGSWRLPSISFLVNRWRILNKLTANRQISFTDAREYAPRRLILRGFLQQSLGLAFGGAS